MFSRLREQHRRQLIDNQQMPFTKLFDQHTQEDSDE
jgi:hypothetical protein